MSVSDVTEKIQQLVFDENKVVTYKLLSQELSIHVNKAKQLLNEYMKEHDVKGEDKLNVYYALSGFQKYNGHQIHKLVVVSKKELEKIKKDFSVLSSVHIYSIQKSPIVDECSLYAFDSVLTKNSDNLCLFSAIKHPDVKIRKDGIVKYVESSDSKEKNKNLESQAKKQIEQKPSISGKKPNALFSSWQKKDGEVKNEQKAIKEQNDLPPSVAKNSVSASDAKSNRSPQKSSKMTEKGSKNNIMNMFSKQTVKSTATKANAQNAEKSIPHETVTLKEEQRNEMKTPVVERNEMKTPVVERNEMKTPVVERKEIRSASKNKQNAQKKRRKHQMSNSNSENESDNDWKKPKKKKHKRIVSAFSDSESENEEEKDKAQRDLMDSESPIKEENGIELDEEEPIPPTPPPPTTNGKKKTLKAISKTFEDEDGFLVTQKVKEYVTDSEGSDGEDPIPKKLAPKPVPKPDIKQNFVNKKQSSLMSFFKQK